MFEKRRWQHGKKNGEKAASDAVVRGSAGTGWRPPGSESLVSTGFGSSTINLYIQPVKWPDLRSRAAASLRVAVTTNRHVQYKTGWP